MRNLVRALNATLAVALVLNASLAGAQTIRSGGPSGTLVSASVPAPPGSAPIVYMTPATGFFVLTTACFPLVSFGVSASGFGRIPADDFCIHYSPGLALPQSSTITCNYSCPGCTSTGVNCTVGGVVTKK
jgi:hypothetical protein